MDVYDLQCVPKVIYVHPTYFTVIYRITYGLEWRTIYALKRGLFWCSFPGFRCNGGLKTKITHEWAHKHIVTRVYTLISYMTWRIPQWASCQIRKIVGAHAPGMPGTFSPSPQVSDPDMHHGTCVTHVPWCMPGWLTNGFLWNRRRGKTFPAFPAHAQPAILRIW